MTLASVPPSVLRIYHRDRGQFLSVLRAAIHVTSQYEVVPEIVEIFEDQAVKFLEIFGGQVISVPPFSEVVAQMRRVAIWVALKSLPEEERHDVAKTMAIPFAMHKKRILETFHSMDALMESLGFELRNQDEISAEEEEAKEE